MQWNCGCRTCGACDGKGQRQCGMCLYVGAWPPYIPKEYNPVSAYCGACGNTKRVPCTSCGGRGLIQCASHRWY